MGSIRWDEVKGRLALFKRRQVPCVPVHVDSDGRIGDLDPATKAAGAGPHEICLILPPGLVLLRRLQARGLDKKSLASSLRLHAEESLPAGMDEYYVDTWSISNLAAGLAALPKEPLRRARRHLARRKLKITRVLVPELSSPGRSGAGLALWSGNSAWTLCLWDAGQLCEWHVLPRGMSAENLMDLVAAAQSEAPTWIALDRDCSADADLRSILAETWPDAEILDAADESLATPARLGDSPAFESFFNEQTTRPASAAQKWRLAVMLTGAIVAGLFFFFSEVRHLEREAEHVRHRVSLLKVQANRSGQIASRIGQAVQELDELRTMTVERRGILYVLKTLGSALPGRVKLMGMSVERSGAVALEGVAKTELDITLLLGELGRSAVFSDPRLTFTQKETRLQEGQAEPLLRFRLEARLRTPLGWLPKEPEET